MRRVGFIIDSMVPSLTGLMMGRCGLRGYFTGQMSDSPGAFMRFGWIADEVNKKSGGDVMYEMYRPWRRNEYKAIVFLKSMGRRCYKLAQDLKRAGVKIVFDANVDYFSKPHGQFYYDGMAPSESQIADAIEMAKLADGVIADSEYIALKCMPYNNNVQWVPDNVNMGLVPEPVKNSALTENGRLKLFWCGESVKLIDLLAIENVLAEFADKVKLFVITNDLSSQSKWHTGLKQKYDLLMAKLDVEYIDYSDIPHLLQEYIKGGVFVSPRYMDNNYNHGHTEWKITLPMACGMPVICSPVPSYIKVSGRTEDGSVQICRDPLEWKNTLDYFLSSAVNYARLQADARRTVEIYYNTRVVADLHLSYLIKIIGAL